MKPNRQKPSRIRRQAQRQSERLVTPIQARQLARWFAKPEPRK